MYFATLNAEGICTGIQSSPGIIPGIDVTDEMDSGITTDANFLWRKYVNGQWSAEKYPPAPPEPGTSTEEQINALKARQATTDQLAAENSLNTQQLTELLIDLGVI